MVSISIQTALQSGLPSFNIVGLPGKSVCESKFRIKSALRSIGIDMPVGSLTVNLSPADLYKDGSYFDLPIILSILSVMDVVKFNVTNIYSMGEIDLEGRILPSIPLFAACNFLMNRDDTLFILPIAQLSHTNLFKGLKILPASSLKHLIDNIKNNVVLDSNYKQVDSSYIPKFVSIYGQNAGKRGIEIAAAGRHSILLSGAPGSGKTMLANRLHSLLPNLKYKDYIENFCIRSIYGEGISDISSMQRPALRAPHHSASLAAIIGGGTKKVRPGEVSLAHKGMLFMDEFPEFDKHVIDALREPLEKKSVLISRASGNYVFPCDFLFCAAMNMCKCGRTTPNQMCEHGERCVLIYKQKISAPIQDRIALHIVMSTNHTRDEETDPLQSFNRVLKAHEFKAQRKESIVFDDAMAILNKALANNMISNRSYNNILSVARTIADLAQRDEVNKHDVLEALQYR